MNVVARCALLAILLVACISVWAQKRSAPDPLDRYNVVWETPSRNSSGSMPLGNGDIGLNVWVEDGGDLLIYISKTDAWSDCARLLKLGRVRVALRPNPFQPGQPFRQTLRLRQGEIEIRAGQPQAEVTLHVWVDANQPVIRIETEGKQPFTLQASLELWREKTRALTGIALASAYGMADAPHPVMESGDTVLPSANRITWFHRNNTSIWPETMKLQGLGDFKTRSTDPLLGRTFGGIIAGANLESSSPTTLHSAQPQTRQMISIYCQTRQTATPMEWERLLEQQMAQIDAIPLEQARAAHNQWWSAFWNRSWLRIGINPGQPSSFPNTFVATAPTPSRIPVCIGASHGGGNAFHGDIDRVRIFNRALSPGEIGAHANRVELAPGRDASCVADYTFDTLKDGAFPNLASPELPARIKGEIEVVDGAEGKALRLNGKGWLEIANAPALQLTQAFTLEAWIAPRGEGRIIEKSFGSYGFVLDTFGGLRAFVRAGTLAADPHYQPGVWTHVAFTFDTHEGMRLYANGRLLTDTLPGLYEVQPEAISQGYALQRFISACAGRGAFPIKFNGSIFTVDAGGDPDYRAWGGAYWFQNTRLAYWPMPAAGDVEQMLPLFRMYQSALPLATERTRRYFAHDGAYFPETLYFWGTWTNDNYGWDRKGKPISQVMPGAVAKHYNGNLELLALMCGYYAYTDDKAFATSTLLPMADAILPFWEQHFTHDKQGRLRMENSQALESYEPVLNPMPDVAGMQRVLDELLALPKDVLSPARRAHWLALRQSLPPLPMKQVGKQTLLAVGESVGGGPGNLENPELYAIFPYRLFGVSKPGLEIARATFAQRGFMGNHGWEQDDTQAAFLGLTEIARQYVSQRFLAKNDGSRFPAFWGPNYDWVPDQDHGSNAMMALQSMLLQADGDRLLLFPAWPKEWNVEFKLHAPHQTTIEGVYHAGQLETLHITPASRAKDLVVMIPR